MLYLHGIYHIQILLDDQVMQFLPIATHIMNITFYDAFTKFSIKATHHQNRITCYRGSLYLERQIFIEIVNLVCMITILRSISHKESETYIPKFYFCCDKFCSFTIINHDRRAYAMLHCYEQATTTTFKQETSDRIAD